MGARHQSAPGDFLQKIAAQHGFTDPKIIWNDGGNAALRERRTDGNLLNPGDPVAIPDKKEKQEARGTGQSHGFSVGAAVVKLAIAVHDEEDKPLSGASCELKIGTKTLTGTTNGQGVFEKEVPLESVGENAELTVKRVLLPKLRWTLKIGYLTPVSDGKNGAGKVLATGVQARLNNLGYPCGAVDGTIGPRTHAALKGFQVNVMGRDTPTGEADKETLTQLEKTHGV